VAPSAPTEICRKFPGTTENPDPESLGTVGANGELAAGKAWLGSRLAKANQLIRNRTRIGRRTSAVFEKATQTSASSAK
jgi:hypothetical protein